jgi:ribose transport system permease protein
MSTTTAPSSARTDEAADRPSAVQRYLLPALERYGLILLLVLLFLVFATLWNRPATFRSTANIQTVLGTYSVPAILALAAIIPLVCGQFDLTVGPVAGLTAMTTAGAFTNQGSPMWLAIIIALAFGLIVGMVNGYLVAYVKVNAFITTLGVSSLISGFITLYAKGSTILVSDTTLANLGSLNWLGIPRLVFIVVILAALTYYFLEHTPVGRYLHSVGSNETAARLVGLSVERLTFLTFVLSALLASIAGVLLLARNGSADPQLGGLALTLPALAAAFLGATAIRPGQFNVLGTLVAVLFVAFSLSGLNLNGASDWVTDVFTGGTLVIAVAISTIVARKRAASG